MSLRRRRTATLFTVGILLATACRSGDPAATSTKQSPPDPWPMGRRCAGPVPLQFSPAPPPREGRVPGECQDEHGCPAQTPVLPRACTPDVIARAVDLAEAKRLLEAQPFDERGWRVERPLTVRGTLSVRTLHEGQLESLEVPPYEHGPCALNPTAQLVLEEPTPNACLAITIPFNCAPADRSLVCCGDHPLGADLIAEGSAAALDLQSSAIEGAFHLAMLVDSLCLVVSPLDARP